PQEAAARAAGGHGRAGRRRPGGGRGRGPPGGQTRLPGEPPEVAGGADGPEPGAAAYRPRRLVQVRGPRWELKFQIGIFQLNLIDDRWGQDEPSQQCLSLSAEKANMTVSLDFATDYHGRDSAQWKME
ncbi:unnamed protein product, partial [Prorocentrum cordatum]